MNDYEYKQEARRDRYLERARQAERMSEARYSQARKMGEAIPFGQPILVGHYSEKRDRNYRAKIERSYRKAFELRETAAYYRAKADGVGRGGISSDDPEAVVKLRVKVAKLELNQQRMRDANAAIRKNKKGGPDAQVAALVALGFSEPTARRALEPDFCGRIGFPDYALKNNNANIRRIKERIANLESEAKVREAGPVEQEYADGIRYLEDDGRVQIKFPGKPAAEVRDVLKSVGFKWSPDRGAWVRMLNGSGRYAAKYVLEKIAKPKEGVPNG